MWDGQCTSRKFVFRLWEWKDMGRKLQWWKMQNCQVQEQRRSLQLYCLLYSNCDSKVIRDSNLGFQINPDLDICWITPKI